MEKQSYPVERNGENAVPDRDANEDEPLMASQLHQASAGPGEGCQRSTWVATLLLEAISGGQICQASNEYLACKADVVPVTSTISHLWR